MSRYVPPVLEDTLIAHHTFASHLPKSLAHVASVYCDARPWKILHGKQAGEEKGMAPWELVERGTPEAIEQLLKYNASDVRLTALAWRRMQPDLESEQRVYESDKAVAQMCRRMTETGIGLDVEARAELSAHLRARRRGLLGAMRDLVGKKSFHPFRLGELRSALFGKFKAPLLRPTPTGQASTNNETLEWLTKDMDKKAGQLADLVLRYRSASKTLGSYVDNVDFVETPGSTIGRVHPPWSLGPVTGRLSCWLMTLPRYSEDWEAQVRRMYVADPKSTGCRLVAQVHDAAIFEVEGQLVYYDLSQAELRCAAHFSGDESLIEACRGDVHAENAKVVFADVPETMKRLARANELSPHLDNKGKPLKWKAVAAKLGGCKEERDIAKNCSFCITYEGSAERAFITLSAAGKKATMSACEELVRRFHARYKVYYRYIDTNEAYVREHGHLRTVLLGRIRWLGWFSPRTEIANYPIQSGIADIHNERLPLIERRVTGLRKADAVKRIIAEEWQRPIELPNGKSFVMPIDLKSGARWSDFG